MNPLAPVTAVPAETKLRPAGLWPAAVLFLITALVFYRAAKGDFLVYDDSTFVTRNPHVNTGWTWDNVVYAFTGMQDVNWEPLTTLSHLLDCQFFKLKPWGHHLVNVLLHAFNTAGLFLLLRKLTRATWRSWLVAALFGLHPLRVESVAWIAERKDVLCMAFWLLATWAYTCYVERGRTRAANWYYRLCLVLFALGLMAKPMMVTFPCVLMLLDVWPLRRLTPEGWRLGDLGNVLLDKIPMLMLSALDCVVTFLLQKQYGALDTVLPFSARAGNALMAYAHYLRTLFWPTDLAVLYPLEAHWTALQLSLAGALVVGCSLMALGLRRRAPWALVGWFWFLGTLVPVIGLVQVGMQAFADRYTYLPSIGIALLLVWGGYEVVAHRRPGWWVAPALAACAACAVLSYKQLGYWEDNRTLFEHTVKVTRDNYLADTILGDIYRASGNPSRAQDLFHDALNLQPGFVPAVELLKSMRYERDMGLGKQLLQQRMADQALQPFLDAKEVHPDSAEAHYSLGVIYKLQGKLPEAKKELRVALLMKPDSYQARRLLAFTLVALGQKEAALKEFEAALRDQPNAFEAHFDMAQALALVTRRPEAIAQLKQALQLRPGEPNATRRLAELETAESH